MKKRKRPKPSSDKILEASERVFAKQGYGETTLRDLMAGARVSTTAFYARFQSKEEVLDALVLRLLGELGARANEELPHAQGLDDGFQRGTRILHEVLVPRRDLVRITLTEAAASAQITKTLGRLYTTLADMLRAQLDATVDGIDTSATAWSLVGALNMQILRWAVYEQVSDAALKRELDAIAESFLPGLRAKKKKKK